MVDSSFFEESREQSRIKSRIVAKYFWAWAKVMVSATKSRGNRIAYMDLFAGPGRYNDRTPSTPVIVLQKAIQEPDLREMLVTIFNDKNRTNVDSLRETVSGIPGIETLKYQPQIRNEEVGQKMVDLLQNIRLVPTLLFVDPWGYKGLSLALINSVLQNWGCDFVLFFNYNRVNPGLNNEAVRDHMNDLFGESRADRIREQLEGLAPAEREALILEELSQALSEVGATYVLPFGFRNEQGTRTKHHLIFGSKNFKGYEIMKEIMAGESSEREQGVGSFTYCHASERQPALFALTRPLDDLEETLLARFAGQQLTMREVYERHSVGTPYIKSNYKKVLTKMETSGAIKAQPPAERRRKLKGEATFADDVLVVFPPRSVK